MQSKQSPSQDATPRTDPRKALEDSERAATETEPENFKDRSTEDKVVEIGPDMTDDPIKGIDADEKPGSTR